MFTIPERHFKEDWFFADIESKYLASKRMISTDAVNFSSLKSFCSFSSRKYMHSPFHGKICSFALSCNLTWMRGNFGLKLQIKIARKCLAYRLDFIVMQMSKVNLKKRAIFLKDGLTLPHIMSFRYKFKTDKRLLTLTPLHALEN